MVMVVYNYFSFTSDDNYRQIGSATKVIYKNDFDSECNTMTCTLHCVFIYS